MFLSTKSIKAFITEPLSDRGSIGVGLLSLDLPIDSSISLLVTPFLSLNGDRLSPRFPFT